MTVTVNGGGGTTLTFNVSGSSATNYANDLPGSFPAVSTLSNGGTESTVAGALNVVYSGGPSSDYTLTSSDQYSYIAVGDPETLTGSSAGDTVFGGADLTYIEAPTGHDNRVVFTTGTNSFVGSANDFGDTIAGGSGYDTITTGGGPSTVFSGSGHTLAYLNDTVAGDLVVMQSGVTTVYANGVSDTVAATASGTIYGGTGTLTFVAPGTTASLSVSVVAGSGTTDLFGGSNLDLTLSGGGTPIFVAGAGNETLDGAASSGFAFFGSSDTSAVDSVIGGGSDYFSTGAGTEYITAGSGLDSFNIADAHASITISDFSSADSVSFASPIATQGEGADGDSYSVTLTNGTTVDFIGITSLPSHTTG